MFSQIQEFITKRDYKKAESTIAKLLRTELSTEDSAALLLLRAKTRLLSGRSSDAIQDWKQAEEISKSWVDKLENQQLLADCYLTRYENASVGFAQKSDVRVASSIFQEISLHGEEYPNIGWVYYQQGRIALIEGQSYVAETNFHKALFNPSTMPALTAYCYERLGYVAYYESRQSKKSLIYLDKAIDTYPVSEPRLWLVEVYLLKSRVLKKIDINSAIESAQEACNLAESINKTLHAESLLTLAELLSIAGIDIENIEILQRFMQVSKSPVGIDATWSRVYEMLGDSYFTTAQYSDSITAYQSALRYNPDHPWEETIYYRIAKAHYQQKQYVETIENLKFVLTDCEDYRIYNLLANALYAIRDFGQAAQAYHQAINLAPVGVDVETMQYYYQLSQQMNPPL